MSEQNGITAATRVAGVLNSIIRGLSEQHSADGRDYACYQLECIMRLLARYHDHFANVDQALEKLEEARHILEMECTSWSSSFQVPVVRTGDRGRPYFSISREKLEYFLEFEFTVPDIARLMSVSVKTVKRRLKDCNLSVKQLYSDISSEDLKHIVSAYLDINPKSGYRMVNGYLRSIGIRVTESRLTETMRAVDPFGTLLRGLFLNPIQRRTYSVPAPLSMWHIDGYHKLIRWRIVIHAGIDGYSRKIMYLRASDNNRATTVHKAFVDALQTFGLPHCVRSDKGGENVMVARFMLEHPLRGPERRCFITGRSVHKQRIERLWRDLWQSVACSYHVTFQHLEAIGALDPDNDTHLLCLHYVMLPRINEHLNLFRQTWDRHRISSAGNRSPQQLWISGQLTSGAQPAPPVNLAEWGIDWEGPVPMSDSDVQITVPEHPLRLAHHVNGLLRENAVNPMKASSCFGADVYLEALHLATTP